MIPPEQYAGRAAEAAARAKKNAAKRQYGSKPPVKQTSKAHAPGPEDMITIPYLRYEELCNFVRETASYGTDPANWPLTPAEQAGFIRLTIARAQKIAIASLPPGRTVARYPIATYIPGVGFVTATTETTNDKLSDGSGL